MQLHAAARRKTLPDTTQGGDTTTDPPGRARKVQMPPTQPEKRGPSWLVPPGCPPARATPRLTRPVKGKPWSRSAALRAVDTAQGRLAISLAALDRPSRHRHALWRTRRLRHDPESRSDALRAADTAQREHCSTSLAAISLPKSRGHDPWGDPTPKSCSAAHAGGRHSPSLRSTAHSMIMLAADTAQAALDSPQHVADGPWPRTSARCGHGPSGGPLPGLPGRAPPSFLPHFVPPANCIGLPPHLVRVLSRELDLRRVL